MDEVSENTSIQTWAFFLTIPILALLFVYAAHTAYKTFREFSFDSGVLLTCASINVMAIFVELFCIQQLNLVNQIVQATLILVITYRTGLVLAMRGHDTCHNLGTATVLVLGLCLAILFVSALAKPMTYQYVAVRIIDLILASFVISYGLILGGL